MELLIICAYKNPILVTHRFWITNRLSKRTCISLGMKESARSHILLQLLPANGWWCYITERSFINDNNQIEVEQFTLYLISPPQYRFIWFMFSNVKVVDIICFVYTKKNVENNNFINDQWKFEFMFNVTATPGFCNTRLWQ